MQWPTLRVLYISRSHIYHALQEEQQCQYICKRRYNDLSVRKYTEDEAEHGRENGGTKEKEKKGQEKRARRIEEMKRESEKTLKLNIKLHFAIGSSRRKREDPTRRNSVVATKKESFKEFYFSGIKLFAVRIVLNKLFVFEKIAEQHVFSKTCETYNDNFKGKMQKSRKF